jgi:hypothetical protein
MVSHIFAAYFRNMKFVYTLILVAFSLRLAAQTNVPVLSPVFSSDKLLYAQKVEKFKRMKTTGFLMAGAGTILAIVGISNLASVDYTGSSSSSSGGPANDPKYASGILMFYGGVGLLGGGIPLAVIGSKQSKKWQRKLDGLTFNLKLNPRQQGLTLVYKF